MSTEFMDFEDNLWECASLRLQERFPFRTLEHFGRFCNLLHEDPKRVPIQYIRSNFGEEEMKPFIGKFHDQPEDHTLVEYAKLYLEYNQIVIQKNKEYYHG